MNAKLGILALLAGAHLAACAWAQGSDDPSFGDLIRRSEYLRNLANQQSTQPAIQPAARPAQTTAAPAAPDSALAAARAAEKEKRFSDAAKIVRLELEKTPRRAKLRYYLAYIYYAEAQNTSSEDDKRKLLERAREEIYRTLDLQGDKSDPENTVWVANAEVLFDRISGSPNRPIPPVHGRVVRPFSGRGGILVGSVLGTDGRPLYDISGKPVASFGNGVVEDAGLDRNMGWVVRVRYRDASGQPFVAEYGNLADCNGLKPGMTVESSTILGHVGKGAGRDEPTLFLQIQRQGTTYDPALLLTGNAQKGSTF